MPIIQGVDVSRNQRPSSCDWSRAYEAGVRFCYVKGSEGAGGPGAYVDDKAAEHIAAIRKTPISVGMYHFARPDNRFRESRDPVVNGKREAEHLISTAIALGVAWTGLPVAIDCEKYTPADLRITDAQRDAMLVTMIDEIEAVLKRLPVVYTGPNFWGDQHTRELASTLHARGVPLWLVKYGRGADPSETILGWPWSIWQHSGGGDFAYAPAIPGLPSPIDQNRYRGTAEEFRGLLGS